MGYVVSSVGLGKSFPCCYARCIPYDFIPGINLLAGSSFYGQIFLVSLTSCNSSVTSGSFSRFTHYLVRTSHKDSDLITHFLISQMWTTRRSARVTWIIPVVAFSFGSWWLAKHWETILLGIPGQTGYLRALFSKGSFSNKLSYLHLNLLWVRSSQFLRCPPETFPIDFVWSIWYYDSTKYLQQLCFPLP